MKRGILLLIIAGMLAGTACCGFVTGQVGMDGFFGSGDYEPFNLSEPINSGWYDIDIDSLKDPINAGWYDIDIASLKKPINPGWFGEDISGVLFPLPEETDVNWSQWEKVPLIKPEPLPLSKDEVFRSFSTESESKKSLISFQKGDFFF
jgi:hypothetical protein